MTAVAFSDSLEPPCFASDELAVTAWAAAVIDGEGCVGCSWSQASNRPRRSAHSYVSVMQAEKSIRLLRTMVLFFGGNIIVARKATKRVSGTYTWSLYGRNALPFLKRILRCLVLKEEQARLLIELEERRAAEVYGARPRSPEFMKYAEGVIDRMHELNWTGPTLRALSDSPTNPRHGGRPLGMRDGQGRNTVLANAMSRKGTCK
jgi:hypothetical protein